jgi:hypothetical protein
MAGTTVSETAYELFAFTCRTHALWQALQHQIFKQPDAQL